MGLCTPQSRLWAGSDIPTGTLWSLAYEGQGSVYFLVFDCFALCALHLRFWFHLATVSSGCRTLWFDSTLIFWQSLLFPPLTLYLSVGLCHSWPVFCISSVFVLFLSLCTLLSVFSSVHVFDASSFPPPSFLLSLQVVHLLCFPLPPFFCVVISFHLLIFRLAFFFHPLTPSSLLFSSTSTSFLHLSS